MDNKLICDVCKKEITNSDRAVGKLSRMRVAPTMASLQGLQDPQVVQEVCDLCEKCQDRVFKLIDQMRNEDNKRDGME